MMKIARYNFVMKRRLVYRCQSIEQLKEELMRYAQHLHEKSQCLASNEI